MCVSNGRIEKELQSSSSRMYNEQLAAILGEGIEKQIVTNSPLLKILILDNNNIKDEHIIQLFKILANNSQINEIQINDHNLTSSSYDQFLNFIKSHPNIISFSFSPIEPINMHGAWYNKAIKNVLKKNRQIVTSNANNHNSSPNSLQLLKPIEGNKESSRDIDSLCDRLSDIESSEVISSLSSSPNSDHGAHNLSTLISFSCATAAAAQSETRLVTSDSNAASQLKTHF